MACPDCGAELLAFPVPDDVRALLPGETAGAALCPRCLGLHPESAPPDSVPDFQRVSDAFPADSTAAVPMALLVGLLDNLAMYRSEIADLLARVERAGTDPLLVLDRLADDDDIETDIDLRGRRRHLEQLL